MARKKQVELTPDEQLRQLEVAIAKNIESLSNEEIIAYAAELKKRDPATAKAIERVYIALAARVGDSPESFACFYEMIFWKKPPRHTLEWVRAIYEAKARGKGVVIEAFRGSTKTTIATIAFTAYRIGKEPNRANLLIQVGDDIATDNTAQIADIIANNPGWKMVFPHVVPDYERGWGAGGYEVKIKEQYMSYEKWRENNAERKDPTLVGVGYKSREIIGKHPDGVLVVDDIHDENNTASERELETVRKILTGTIFPAMTKDTWRIFIGTPWVENDCLGYVASTGEFLHVKTPVYVGEGEDRVYTWSEKFGEVEVEKARKLSGSIQFARMFLLDLTAAHNKIFKYQLYPASEIRSNWVMVGGLDYAGSMDEFKNKAGTNDLFALAYVVKLPGYGAVVYDGVIDRPTQGQAEVYVNRAQEMFPNWKYAVVEGDGKGEEFIQTIKRNPGLRIIPMKTKGRGKGERLERQMGPWLESGTVRISNAETPFLNELRRELDSYPNNTHDDAMDAVYWALRGMPDVLVVREARTELPSPEYRQKETNPFAAFGRR